MVLWFLWRPVRVTRSLIFAAIYNTACMSRRSRAGETLGRATFDSKTHMFCIIFPPNLYLPSKSSQMIPRAPKCFLRALWKDPGSPHGQPIPIFPTTLYPTILSSHYPLIPDPHYGVGGLREAFTIYTIYYTLYAIYYILYTIYYILDTIY